MVKRAKGFVSRTSKHTINISIAPWALLDLSSSCLHVAAGSLSISLDLRVMMLISFSRYSLELSKCLLKSTQ